MGAGATGVAAEDAFFACTSFTIWRTVAETSAADCGRPAGSLLISRSIRSASAGGRFGASARAGVGVSVVSAISTAIAVGPLNGILPVAMR